MATAKAVKPKKASAKAAEVPASTPKAEEVQKAVANKLSPLEESREALKHPLSAGQVFFESPEGFIIVAEAGKTEVWCRHANNGKGMLINPRR